MEEFLVTADLGHLTESMSGLGLSECYNWLGAGRPVLLENLKAAGISKIPDRQKLAKVSLFLLEHTSFGRSGIIVTR